MAYCLKCGAYIPDGQTVCLACGYDPAAEQKKAEETRNQRSGSAIRYETRNNEEMRRKLEEQRKRSQEQNRQWAEQERQRREEQAAREEARRRQQEESRQWAEQEYEKRQHEQASQMRSFEGADQPAKEGNKVLGALSYLSLLFTIPYLFTPQDRFAVFHAKQGLKLFLFGILADAVGALTGFGWILNLARLYLIYKGMSNALNGRTEPLPWIGTIGEK